MIKHNNLDCGMIYTREKNSGRKWYISVGDANKSSYQEVVRRTKLNTIREEFWKNIESFDGITRKEESAKESSTCQSIDDVDYEPEFNDNINTSRIEMKNIHSWLQAKYCSKGLPLMVFYKM